MRNTIFVIVALLAATAAFPQTAVMRVAVPFQFHAGDQVMPAGDYRVQIDPAYSRLAVLLDNSNVGGFVTAHLSQRPDTGSAPGSLVFHKYGNHYFLRKVWRQGGLVGYELPRTKAEREIARTFAVQEVAVVR